MGKVYRFEPVPTDVELAPNGKKLYVTSLPGGPEDPSLGANGRVLRVKLKNGHAKAVVRGLISPTGLAIDSSGDMFIAELFLGQIVEVKAGTSTPDPYVSLPLPADVE